MNAVPRLETAGLKLGDLQTIDGFVPDPCRTCRRAARSTRAAATCGKGSATIAARAAGGCGRRAHGALQALARSGGGRDMSRSSPHRNHRPQAAFPASRGASSAGPKLSVKAVDGITIDIPRRSVLGLVGESGSGKSTFGRAVMGLERPPRHAQIRRHRHGGAGAEADEGAAPPDADGVPGPVQQPQSRG